MFTFRSNDGEFCSNGTFEGTGYSGHAEGRNNPELEWKPNIGPIPRGRYKIGKPYFHPRLGPLTFNLEPMGHSACNRTDFRIHGNNAANDASQGCIVLGRSLRSFIASILDDTNDILEVI